MDNVVPGHNSVAWVEFIKRIHKVFDSAGLPGTLTRKGYLTFN